MPETAATDDQQFYLILKGEIAIFTDKKHGYLRLRAPELPEHAFAAGPWLGEAQIPRNTSLRLQNVQPGRKVPGDYPDMLMILPYTKACPEQAHFDIIVPFPNAILPGAEQDASQMKVTVINDEGTSEMIPMPKRTCLAVILAYDWNGADEPFLMDEKSGRKWEAGGKVAKYRSMHICAAGKTHEEEESLPARADRIPSRRSAAARRCKHQFGGGGNILPIYPPPGLSYHETNLSYFETLKLRRALGEILEGGAGVIPTVEVVHFHGGNCGPIGN